jgi:hypothetical protein
VTLQLDDVEVTIRVSLLIEVDENGMVEDYAVAEKFENLRAAIHEAIDDDFVQAEALELLRQHEESEVERANEWRSEPDA